MFYNHGLERYGRPCVKGAGASTLLQIFPSRKPNHAASAASKLETSPSGRKEKRKENPTEVSSLRKGTLESFIVRSKSSENPSISGVGEKQQDGLSGYVRQSTWPKSSCVSGPNSTDSWLQGCGPHVSKSVPKWLLETELGNASDLNNPKSVNASPVSSQSKLVPDGSRESVSRGHLTQFADDFLSIYVRYGSSQQPLNKGLGSLTPQQF